MFEKQKAVAQGQGIEVTKTQSEFDDKAVAALALQIEQQRQLNREKAEQNNIEKNKKVKATKTRRSTEHVKVEDAFKNESTEAKQAAAALKSFNAEVKQKLAADPEYIQNQETINLLENGRNKLMSVGLVLQSLSIIKEKFMNAGRKLSAFFIGQQAKATNELTRATTKLAAAQTAANATNPLG